MRPGTFLSAGLFAALVAALVFILVFRPQNGGTPPGETAPNSRSIQPLREPPAANPAPHPASPAPDASPATLHPVASASERLHAPDGTPLEDLEILENLIQTYRKHHGGNPTGENEEIVRTLAGGNAKRLAYLPGTHPAIDARGRLLDRWGTPFFFHALSARDLEIHSAGPDRQFGTADDARLGGSPEP